MTLLRVVPFRITPSQSDSSSVVHPLLATMPCAAAVVDENNRIVLVNDQLAAAAGASKESLIGQRTGTVLGCGQTRPQDCDACTELTGFCEVAHRVFTERKPLRTHTQFDPGQRRQAVKVPVNAAPFEFDGRTHALIVIDNGSRPQSSPLGRQQEALYGIVGQHPKIIELFDAIRRVAHLKLPVLIQGESGTGKEMVALALHNHSGRSGELVTVNSGALPEGVLESELFGHVRGAFTGAIRDKRGRFEIANHGTLFLDEIGEITPTMQVKLLRAVQEGTFERVGGEQTLKVDVRLICATNRNIEKDVASGRFRADLFYRISVVPITVPPLRARATDIPLLSRYFLERAAASSAVDVPELPDDTLDVLMRYRWPGNVRELENALHFALLNATDGVLRIDHLPPRIREEVSAHSSTRKLDPLQVNAALRATNGNKVRAAQLLGVSRATLYRVLGDGDDTIAGLSS